MEKSRMKASKISLQEYLHFFHFGKQIDITVNLLNQILSIHGFRKITLPKKEITEAIDSLDLINLSRSTLRDDGVSACALMNLEDIIADVNELNWQDCCITSIQTIGFSSDNQSTSDLSLVPNSDSNDPVETGRSTLENRRKRKKVNSGNSTGGVIIRP